MSAKEYLLKLFYENVWFSERTLKYALKEVEEKDYSLDKVKQILENAMPTMKANYKKVFLRMGNKQEYYKLNQKIFQTNKVGTLVIRSRYTCHRLVGTYKVVIAPYFDYGYKAGTKYKDAELLVQAEDGELSVLYQFEKEQLYQVMVFYLLDGEELPLLQTQVYAVDEDLLERYYLKADLHMHTTCSDGFESPELVAASAREKGMDVIAVTDHNNYEGSVLAEKAAKEYGLSMTVLRGEEYSLEYSLMHILNLGAVAPIDRKFLQMSLLEEARTQEIMAQAEDVGADIRSYAGLQRLLEAIKEMGGVSILCHPFWKPIGANGRMDTPMQTYLDLAKDRKFDGIEIVSGSQLKEYHVSNMQELLARELFHKFDGVPMIGISDSHNYTTDWITGKHYTVIFAKGRETQDILDAIREGWTVAVEDVEQTHQCYGPMRLALFTHFLCEAYFPQKAEAAYLEGRNMKKKLETEFVHRGNK